MKKLLLGAVFLILFIGLIARPQVALAALDQPTGAQIGLRGGALFNQSPQMVVQGLEDANAGRWSGTPQIGYEISTAFNFVAMTVVGAPSTSGTHALMPGVTNFFASGISYLATVPPASSGEYVKYMANRLRIPGEATPAYAATNVSGVGFNSLTPVLQLWSVFRNVSYIAFAIIFVIIGLMVMFRFKIDPKTTASLQAALPKIIFALILVTFSYAIAGFLVDLMYVLIALLLTILKSAGAGAFASDFERNILSGQTIFSFFISGDIGSATNPASSGAGAIAFNAYNAVATAVNQLTANLGGAAYILGGISGGLAFLIVALAILWALFKTWFMLLSAYAHIILYIVFAPLMLMMDAVPGQNQFSTWLRNMLAYLLSFPVVVAFMFVALLLSSSVTFKPETGFVPPLIGGNSQSAIQAIVGLAILLTIPKAVEIMQETLKAPKHKWDGAWETPMKFGATLVSSYPREQAYMRMYNEAVANPETRRAAVLRGILGMGYNNKWWGQPPRPPNAP